MDAKKILLILFLPIIATAKSDVTFDNSPNEYAKSRLVSEGFSKSFVNLIVDKIDDDERDKVVQLNVLGFLYTADYSKHYSKDAIRKCRAFLKKYKLYLKSAERLHGVPKELIAALLWVETKHGKRLGSFHVPSVFFYLLQADHPHIVQKTIEATEGKLPASEDSDQVKSKIIARSKAKANWALSELRSLSKIHSEKSKDLSELRGSYAGAFGLPQFIPSSYLQWARPRTKRRYPNLFFVNDAIHSVAFYLKFNGWKKGNQASQREALFHYNRSQGYVDIIMKLASELGFTPKKSL